MVGNVKRLPVCTATLMPTLVLPVFDRPRCDRCIEFGRIRIGVVNFDAPPDTVLRQLCGVPRIDLNRVSQIERRLRKLDPVEDIREARRETSADPLGHPRLLANRQIDVPAVQPAYRAALLIGVLADAGGSVIPIPGRRTIRRREAHMVRPKD